MIVDGLLGSADESRYESERRIGVCGEDEGRAAEMMHSKTLCFGVCVKTIGFPPV